MPGQVLFQANPLPDPSQLPDAFLDFNIKLDTHNYLAADELKAVQKFRRAADYIAAAMIFLKDNVLCEKALTYENIKPRLLGHWGTCPSFVRAYAHMNRIIRKTGLEALYVMVPPPFCLVYGSKTMSVFLPGYTRDYKGLRGLISKFSAPGGFPSHINAETPGAIHEGGELGYALSVSFGAVMDKPNLVVACVVGDGEAETRPTATVARIQIKKIQTAARTGNSIVKPRWPVIILRTPKGLAGPKSFHGELIEGSFHSHQVPLPNAKTPAEELAELQRWLKSYRLEELFTAEGSHVDEILSVIPEESEKKLKKGSQENCMKAIGRFLKEVVNQNPSTFRVFSPDELVSNKFSAVLENSGCNFQWDIASRASGGRGYTLTGRTGLFPSYEAFLGIVHTMLVQYAKSAKMAAEMSWRQDTSTWTRQEHNGFSHQNPSFIGAVLNLKSISARVYLPLDANCFLSTVSHCLRAKNYINPMVGSKQPTPHSVAGASVWKFASVDDGVDPDVVLVGIGVQVTFEVIVTASLRKYTPDLRVRVANVTDLACIPTSMDAFNNLFTEDKHIHFNYHGYTIELKGLLFGRPRLDRVSIEGYNEEGTTTSPFDMMLANRISRYHIAQAAVLGGSLTNPKVAVSAHETESYFKHLAQKKKDYTFANGQDRPDIFEAPTFN
ncbi:phosphoketolase [Armillaria novae-zelandiae]|uniref:Phosphoketolase n=1 Tax=Armillaria novae-zelandiae TaxID=153914 RepID=A0AA39PK33_9AGAR|nr:phosphoketolase [Armillaria novae-zelandiae]